MNVFLDTNICVYYMKGTYPAIERMMASFPVESIKIPAIVKAELLFGAAKSRHPRKAETVVNDFLFPFEIAPFDDLAAEVYAEIRRQLETKGQPIGSNDLIIAATTIANEGMLVTHNVKEFNRVRGLTVTDWVG